VRDTELVCSAFQSRSAATTASVSARQDSQAIRERAIARGCSRLARRSIDPSRMSAEKSECRARRSAAAIFQNINSTNSAS
jgi:hypothetical protein